jgi:hypothetical protein
MSNELVIPKGFQKPAIFQNRQVEGNLAKGIHTGFGVIGYKGRQWSVRYRGEETYLMNQHGDPLASIPVVILDSAPNVSKVYYAGTYQEGSTEAPDCYSVNGLVPENDSKKKQSNTCGACPHNVWGSRINEATGKKGKACMDSKRAAVVPFDDIENKIYGGPMLLRIPAASMANAANYATQLNAMGYDTYMVGTKVSFKVGESYPHMEFGVHPFPMTEEQAEQVDEMRKHPLVQQILGSGGEFAQAAAHEAAAQASALPEPTASPVGTVEQPKVTPATASATTTAVKPKATNGSAPAGAMKTTTSFGGGAAPNGNAVSASTIEAKKRGRPPGSTNKEKPTEKQAAPTPEPMPVEEDADFDTLLARDLAEYDIPS